MSFRFGEEVASVESSGSRHDHHAGLGQEDRRRDRDVLRRPAGQHRAAEPRPGRARAPTTRGRLVVDGTYATEVPHIYAVGDVIGFPALAATSMDQGRLAASYAFGEPARELQAPAADRHLHHPRDLLLREARGRPDQRVDPVRGRHLPLPRAGPRPDHRRLVRDAEADRARRHPGDPRRPRLRHQRHRAGAHRPGDHGLRRHRRLPGGHGAQLPDAVRGVQGGRAGRHEQAARGGPVHQPRW